MVEKEVGAIVKRERHGIIRIWETRVLLIRGPGWNVPSKNTYSGTSLVVQRLGIYLPTQGT